MTLRARLMLSSWAAAVAAASAACALAWLALHRDGKPPPRALALIAFVVVGSFAAVLAWRAASAYVAATAFAWLESAVADGDRPRARALLADIEAGPARGPAAGLARAWARGMVASAEGSWEDALSAYAPLLALDPRGWRGVPPQARATVFNNAAWCLVQLGRDPERAASLARRAVDACPEGHPIRGSCEDTLRAAEGMRRA